VWPQYTNVTDRETDNGPIARAKRFTNGRPKQNNTNKAIMTQMSSNYDIQMNSVHDTIMIEIPSNKNQKVNIRSSRKDRSY